MPNLGPCVRCLIVNDENTLELLIIEWLLVTGSDLSWAAHPLATTKPGNTQIRWQLICVDQEITPLLHWSVGAGRCQYEGSPYLVVRTWLTGSSHNQSIMSTNINLKTLTMILIFCLSTPCFQGFSSLKSLCKTQLAIKRLKIGNVKSSREINLYQRKNLNIWMKVEMWLSMFWNWSQFSAATWNRAMKRE